MRNLITCCLLSVVTAPNAHANEDSTETVIGGTRVPEGKWRDVVFVVGRGASCTGTLIAPDVVLTAGHCIDIDPYEVWTDTVDYGKPGGDRIPVKWARAYPSWESRYDVGVIMLDHVARGQPRKIAAACSAREGLIAGAMVHIVGFGVASPSGDDNNTLMREANVPVIDPTCTMDASCAPKIAPTGEFMAGGNGTDSCFGDSGGPVYLDTAEGPVLIGVVSRGLATGGAPCGHGGVYIRADKVVSWVQKVTGARIQRSTCDGQADDAGGEVPGGGCSTSGAAGSAVVALAGIGLLRRSRRKPRS